MAVKFSKYHGLGNDFVIVDLRTGVRDADCERVQEPEVVRAICDRRFGVGADGVLAVLSTSEADARMRVLNADGGEAEMCGNGLRCVVKHLYERDPAMRRDVLVIDTGAGSLSCRLDALGDTVTSVTVDMGRPRLQRKEIPMTGPGEERCVGVPLTLQGGVSLAITAVSMGNPHAISFCDQSGAELRRMAENVGPLVEHHDTFPQRTNAEFARVHGPRDIELVVWERGCGITLACGTGACATAVAACLGGHASVGEEIAIRLLGGDLAVTVAEDYRTVLMRGRATHVFEGELDLKRIQSRQASS